MSITLAEVIVHLPALGRVIAPSRLTVQVEDTSHADAPAAVVTRLVMDMPSVDLIAEASLRFQMPYTGRSHDLSVSATLTIRSSGRRGPGDLITPAAVRITPHQASHVHLTEYIVG